MSEKRFNRDMRPEGGVLLSAAMFGAWNEALFIAQHATASGMKVQIDAGEHRCIRGIPLQRIEVLS